MPLLGFPKQRFNLPLGVLGAYQVLFIADSEPDLLDHLRRVPMVDYQAHRQRIAQCEATRQQRYRFHHDPTNAIQVLLDQHASRRAALTATQRPDVASDVTVRQPGGYAADPDDAQSRRDSRSM